MRYALEALLIAGAATGGWMLAAPAANIHAGAAARAFGFCDSGGGTDCVVDGDTFWMDGTKIRVADIDAPETHPPRCAEEKRLGEAATRRLQALLSAGPVTLEIGDRATDRYGRALRIVTRGGKSLGAQLVSEGLARRWTGRRQPWCPAAA
jgi:endonuclease YncB( thermonuclease family)